MIKNKTNFKTSSPCSNIHQTSSSPFTNFFPLHHLFLCFLILCPPLFSSLFSPSLSGISYPLPQVQDAVRCRMGGCKDDSENSPDSCKNGQVQIMVNSIPFHPTLPFTCLTLTGWSFTAIFYPNRMKHDCPYGS